MTCTISINQTSAVPKYRQIVNCIIKGIERKAIGMHERLPSINKVSLECDVSRDTVEKAYRQLKTKGVIVSVPGKGYFTVTSALQQDRKVLLIFNKLSVYKKTIFEGFVNQMAGMVNIDFQVYHENFDFFEKILQEKAGLYTDYVIIPSFKGEEAIRANQLIKDLIPMNRLWILNAELEGLTGAFGAVVQDYERDIYTALSKTEDLLQKYEQVTLIFPTWSNYSRKIIRGFQQYCLERKLKSNVIFKNFEKETIQKHTAYIVILDHDLVTLVKKIKEQQWACGHDVGILAYNDSPLKEVLLDGISVMSTEHDTMGSQLAKMMLNDEQHQVENEFNLILRHSL
jgi:DNA-binding transcriptional regulator YhcF (GntR family)